MKTISSTSARHRHISIISSRGLGANAGTLPANDEGPKNFFFFLYMQTSSCPNPCQIHTGQTRHRSRALGGFLTEGKGNRARFSNHARPTGDSASARAVRISPAPLVPHFSDVRAGRDRQLVGVEVSVLCVERGKSWSYISIECRGGWCWWAWGRCRGEGREGCACELLAELGLLESGGQETGKL